MKHPPLSLGPHDRLPPTMSRILIVDDDTAEREEMTSALAAAGHEVFEARDAHEALRQILSKKFDAAVVDIVLPSYSGVDVTRAIHGVRGSENLPIVAVTGKTSPSAILEPATFGARCLLRKPFTGEALVKAVEECLQG